MKTVIAYASEYGSAKTCAEMLAGHLDGDTALLDLKRSTALDGGYDTVIIGGSVYAGSIQKEVIRFCTANRDALMGKRLGLYVCCAARGESAADYVKLFPEELVGKAVATGAFGGVFHMDKMKPFHKLIIKMLRKVNKDMKEPEINAEAVAAFAGAIKRSSGDAS
ncbi:MAG: flavodoxin domain-containing protein [Oscillospiraceae bacterium]|nr:flavodoxin domain-containing protein [Oscillospiraceae bacterium]